MGTQLYTLSTFHLNFAPYENLHTISLLWNSVNSSVSPSSFRKSFCGYVSEELAVANSALDLESIPLILDNLSGKEIYSCYLLLSQKKECNLHNHDAHDFIYLSKSSRLR